MKNSIELPFPGFYDSLLSGELDHVEEREAEYFVERQAEDGIAAELRLDAGAYSELFLRHTDYSAAHQHLARQYVAAFDHVASEALGFPLGLQFEEMTSPKYYNFETDRVFAACSDDALAKLWAMSKADGHKTLGALIAKRFTSCDGFASHYPNTLAAWLRKPLADWDHNELGTLLRACLKLAGVYDTSRGEGIEWRCFELMTDGDSDFWTALQEAVDWDAIERDAAELRADKAAELKADDPDYEPPYRCPETPDLFDNGRK